MSAVTTTIDSEACTGCGLCLRTCPSRTLSMSGHKAVVTGSECLACGHCQAVCPADAIRVAALDPGAAAFETLATSEAWLPHGEYDLPRLVQLMRSRRSCRNFLPEPVDLAMLRDLVRIGTTAPSGTNSQTWTFTLLPRREDVEVLALAISEFFRRLNRMASKAWLRGLLRLMGRPQLSEYHRDYSNAVTQALIEWDQDRTDRLFHHAPSVIVVATRPGASCPAEDALLATQNMLLGAHAMGLGTCLIGYAVAAMREDASIQARINMPGDETVHAVLALGHPYERYQRAAGRKQALVRAYHAAPDKP